MTVVACVFLVLFSALGLAALVAAVVRSSPAARRRGDGDDDDGGSRSRVPPGPPPEPSGVAPEWWPEFERAFADHVRRREPSVTGE